MKKKTANEMTDQEIMEKAFSKKVIKEVRREIGVDDDATPDKDKQN